MAGTLRKIVSGVLTGLCLFFTLTAARPSQPSSSSSSSSSSLTSPAETCNDPSRRELEALWERQAAWHDSIFVLDAMARALTTRSQLPASLVQVKEHALRDPACPFGGYSRHELRAYRDRTGAGASLCPSHDVINYDENRIPATMFEKKCSCADCGLHSAERRTRHSAHSTLGCRPVYYNAKVMRRVNCAEGRFVYDTVLEPLAVACVCDHQARPESSRPRVHSEG